MDLTARPFRYFIAIAERGTFTSAAQSLNVSQPALSAQIRELERLLGFELFKRSSRNVNLTPEGLQFLDYARRAVLETEFISRAARDIRANPLRIGATHYTSGIDDRRKIIEDFSLNSPKTLISIKSRNYSQIFDDLRDHNIDVAITLELGKRHEESSSELGIERNFFERKILGSKDLSLLVPVEKFTSKPYEISSEDIRDLSVCNITRVHGVNISEETSKLLASAGAKYVAVPEGDAISVMRYASLKRYISVNLGWFDFPVNSFGGPLCNRTVREWNTVINLVLIRNRDGAHPALNEFWESADVSVKSRAITTP
jgi:DNA-binding transcriptional LysR family regulator